MLIKYKKIFKELLFNLKNPLHGKIFSHEKYIIKMKAKIVKKNGTDLGFFKSLYC